MTGAIKEIALILGVVGVCVLLKHSAPGGRVEMVTFWIVLLLPFVLNAAGWLRWQTVRRDRRTALWRKVVGFIGLVANALAMCLPFLVFVYNGFLVRYDMRHPLGLRGFKEIDLYATVAGCLILSLATLVAGIVAPRPIRLTVSLGGFTMASLILSIRLGVL
jgi:hypothetical protein